MMSKTFSVRESIEFFGDWATEVGGKSLAIAGSLKSSDGHTELALNESFLPLNGSIFGDEVYHYPAIHGQTTKSQFVTLLDGVRKRSSINFGLGGLKQPETIVSNLMLIGAHVSPGFTCTEISVRIPGLLTWFGESGITQEFHDKSEGSPAKVIYEIVGVPAVEFSIPSTGAVLSWWFEREFGGDLVNSVVVKADAHLKIKASLPADLNWFLAQVSKVTTLLSMLVGSAMSPDTISAKIAQTGDTVSILLPLRDVGYCHFNNHTDYFMTRASMGVDLSDVFARWFDAFDAIHMPSQLALSVLNSDGLWPHVQFLSLMQSLEGFHRANFGGLYTGVEAYEKVANALIASIPAAVSTDHRASLKSRIRFGNEISLRKRLDGLVGGLDAPLRKHILGGDGAVPGSWIDTRNFYTHWDAASRQNVLGGIEMHKAIVRMRVLLRVLYLNYSGIPIASIAKALLGSNRESQYLIQINNEEHRKRNPGHPGQPIMQVTTSKS